MEEFIGLAALLNLGYAAAAIIMTVYLTRWLDRRARVRFPSILERITHEPLAAALYFGARFLGACLLVGLVLS
jgi:hypothetical protein